MDNKSVSLTFGHNVTKDQLQSALGQILNHFGCPTCGLNGYRVVLGGDEPYFSQIKQELSKSNIPVINVGPVASSER